jgi:hypothetical protein
MYARPATDSRACSCRVHVSANASVEPTSVRTATTSGQATWCTAANTAVAHAVTAAAAPAQIKAKRIISSMTPVPSMPGRIAHAVPNIAVEQSRAARKMRIARFTPAVYHVCPASASDAKEL